MASDPTPLATPIQPAAAEDGAPRFDALAVGSRLQAQTGRADAPLPMGERYVVDGVLGAGATGRVYAVRDRTLERTIAVKVALDADPASVLALVDEARLMARLDHPNVLPVHDADVLPGGQVCLSMKRIAGRTLGAVLADGGAEDRVASPARVIAIIMDVCKAVAYAHHHGIVHQDIKPDNILLGDFGEVLLLDWGSARRREADGRWQGPSHGTPLYMAPEQARGEPATPVSDVYCLGATLWHALLGRVPTWSDDPDRFWQMKRHGVIQEPTPDERLRVPAPLLAIARKALAAEPAARYASVDALLQDLQDYQAGLAIAAFQEGPWTLLWRWARRHRATLGVAAAIVGCLALAGGIWYRTWLRQQYSWHLALAEDFTAPVAELATRWRIFARLPWPEDRAWSEEALTATSHWRPAADGMRADIEDQADLTCRLQFSGAVRITWDYVNRTRNENLNCYFGSNRQTGFTFHVGGWEDPTLVMLTRGPDYERLAWTHIPALQAGRVYHCEIESAERHIRLRMDGQQLIDYRTANDLDAPDAPTFGFDAIREHLTVAHVRVYTQRPPQLVSPLAIADALAHSGRWNDALAQYRLIADAFPRSALSAAAALGSGICYERLHQLDAAERTLAALVDRDARDPLVPYAQLERLRVAEAADDRARRDQLRLALTRWRGHPVLAQALSELSEAGCRELGPVPSEAWLHPPPPHMRERTLAQLNELEHWSTAWDVPDADTRLFVQCMHWLLFLRENDLVLDHVPSAEAGEVHQMRLLALYDAGRFEEVLHDPGAGAVALQVRLAAGMAYDPSLDDPPGGIRGDFDNATRWVPIDARWRAGDHAATWPAYRQRQLAQVAWATAAAVRAGEPDQDVALLVLDRPSVLAFPHARLTTIACYALRRLEAGDAALGLAVLARLEAVAGVDTYCYAAIDARESAGQAAILLLVPLLTDLDAGRPCDPQRLIPRLPWLAQAYRRQGWFLAQAVLGRCDEATFLAQPVRADAQRRWDLAQGVACELRHDLRGAAAAYARVPPPSWDPDVIGHLAAWRAQRLLQAGIPVER